MRKFNLTEIDFKSTMADVLWDWKLLPFGSELEMIRLKELCPVCYASALDFCRIQQSGFRLAWVRCAGCRYREERTLENHRLNTVWTHGFDYIFNPSSTHVKHSIKN